MSKISILAVCESLHFSPALRPWSAATVWVQPPNSHCHSQYNGDTRALPPGPFPSSRPSPDPTQKSNEPKHAHVAPKVLGIVPEMWIDPFPAARNAPKV